MPDQLLFDTDVLIDYLRGRDESVSYVEGLAAQFYISTITVAELYAGVREGAERVKLGAFIGAFAVVPIELKSPSGAGFIAAILEKAITSASPTL